MTSRRLRERSQLVAIKFDDRRRNNIEVAVANPRRAHSNIHQSWPSQALRPIWETIEVDRLQPFELGTLRFVRDPLVLNRPFVTLNRPADNECDLRVLTQVPHLPRRVKSVEEELEIVCDGNSYDGRLRRCCR